MEYQQKQAYSLYSRHSLLYKINLACRVLGHSFCHFLATLSVALLAALFATV